MKIELKNIKHATSQSEETQAFVANVYVNGERVAEASNSGKGEQTNILSFEGKREALQKVEAYLDSLPDIKVFDDLVCKPELHTVVDQLVYLDLVRKDMRKLMRRIWGPKAKIEVFRKDTGKRAKYSVVLGEKIKHNSKVMVAQDAIAEAEKAAGHDTVILNALYAKDRDAAWRQFLELAPESKATIEWTLEAAVAQARKESGASA